MVQDSANARRQFRNLLLQPLLQIKLSLYSIVLALVFAVIFSAALIVAFQHIFDTFLNLTDMREEGMQLLSNHLLEIGSWLILIVALHLCINVLVTIWFTHRLIGPTFAFRRHIQALKRGEYHSRVVLRKGDAFVEVADDLNDLAQTLQRK